MGTGTVARADLVIDNFNVAETNTIFGSGTLLIRASPGTSSFTNAVAHSSTDVIGGFRAASLTTTSGGGSLGIDFGDSNNLSFSLNAPAATGFATLTYDANGAGLGGVDLTQGGANSFFLFFVIFSDAVGGKSLTVTVDDGTNVESHSVGIPANVVVPQNFLLPFSTFTVADLTSVESITLRLDSGAAGDLTIDFFGAASPEPSSMVILGLGAVLSAGYGLRRRLRRTV
jgi:hypothetical protein